MPESDDARRMFALLTDGTTVKIRPAGPADRDAVRDMHAAMSPMKLYLRVFGTQPDALAIPAAAVQIGQQGAYVFAVKDGRTAQLVNVTVDRTVGGMSVISSGLKAGDSVVVDGQLRLVNGAAVQVQTRPEDGVARTGQDGAARRS